MTCGGGGGVCGGLWLLQWGLWQWSGGSGGGGWLLAIYFCVVVLLLF